MPTVKNYAEREFTFWPDQPAPKDLIAAGAPTQHVALASQAVTFPRARAPQGEDQDRRDVRLIPGELEVSADLIQQMKAHPAAKHWFNRDGLVVEDETRAPAPSPAKGSKAA